MDLTNELIILMLFHDFDVIELLFHDFDVIDLLFHDFNVLDLLFHDFDVINLSIMLFLLQTIYAMDLTHELI
jgi:hypothetical protein